MNLASSFYTNVVEHKGKLLIRGVNNGQSYLSRINYSPTLYLPTKEESKYKTLDGTNLKAKRFDSISKAKHFYSEYAPIPEYKIFGMNRYNYQYIADEYKGDMKWNKDYIKIFTLDIETTCEDGFPDPDTAKEKVICITIKNHSNKQILTWGTGDFISKKANVTYVKCQNEKHMLLEFLKFWCKNHPDILTGWNVKFFDLPYLMNRMRFMFDNDTINKMSPWNYVNADRIQFGQKNQQFWNILGVSVLDYFDLYRKFTYTNQESYRLDHIASVELGIQKDENPHETFRDWYTKDYQSFIDYNIKDVELVDALEDKMKLIELCLTMAYEAKVNYTDVLGSVRYWDVLIHNYLMNKGIVIPQKKTTNKSSKYAGAYVKEPQVGMHKWVLSFDLNSLYPHLIMQYNISPETMKSEKTVPGMSVDKLLNKEVDTKALDNVTMTPNGALFNTKKQGFLPEIMAKMYEDRVKYKQYMLEAKQNYVNTKDAKYIKQISKFNNIQMAKKISLNSAYGAIGNNWFRYYSNTMAEAITPSG